MTMGTGRSPGRAAAGAVGIALLCGGLILAAPAKDERARPIVALPIRHDLSPPLRLIRPQPAPIDLSFVHEPGRLPGRQSASSGAETPNDEGGTVTDLSPL